MQFCIKPQIFLLFPSVETELSASEVHQNFPVFFMPVCLFKAVARGICFLFSASIITRCEDASYP